MGYRYLYSAGHGSGSPRCVTAPTAKGISCHATDLVILLANNERTCAVSECCLIKSLSCILSEKYIYILAPEMASPGNQHCANCIGTLSFPILLTVVEKVCEQYIKRC